ncbi:hypothetical protein KAU39_06285 [bacterium]|nr:hypothetical protein [bacterium]
MKETVVITLNCPQCGSSLKIKEGQQNIRCSACSSYLLIKGGEGINKLYISSLVNKSKAVLRVKKWFDRDDTANDIGLSKVKSVKLVYIPLWKLSFKAIGWRFMKREFRTRSYSGGNSYYALNDYMFKGGQENVSKREAKPILRFGEWIVPACGITDFGSEYVKISQNSLKRGLKVLEEDKLQAEAMVFDVTIPAESILEKKEKSLLGNLPLKRSTSNFFQMVKKISTKKMLIYYPLWIIRYDYKGMRYLVSVDGVEEKIVYAHFPGNPHYRVVNFLIVIAVINFVLTSLIQRPGDLVNALLQMKEVFIFILFLLGSILFGYFKSGIKSFRFSDEVVVKNGLRVDKGYAPARNVWDNVGFLARKGWKGPSFDRIFK